ncbi:hypothetical protein GQ43DRAFT_434815 [Delitschia confertaspora ATCC 74209]|uniref:Uncharacterized protein n=1 Tax=Delitschia confertaspora ATCC 74209 TaxID=1513339 RepID=A0A9P4JEC2_9PLEO|nr:hypothetical protein GQ43DRAFT_434815 [Delitschia confertaspora ATCC 74209]
MLDYLPWNFSSPQTQKVYDQVIRETSLIFSLLTVLLFFHTIHMIILDRALDLDREDEQERIRTQPQFEKWGRHWEDVIQEQVKIEANCNEEIRAKSTAVEQAGLIAEIRGRET